MAILMIEDAALYHRDLYNLYIDFSSAFNTVNHQQLLHIASSLGFPEAAIRNIKSIYTNATTVIATPFGDTGAVHIGWGTIQGDTLSPYLFLIFIEPLLRWPGLDSPHRSPRARPPVLSRPSALTDLGNLKVW